MAGVVHLPCTGETYSRRRRPGLVERAAARAARDGARRRATASSPPTRRRTSASAITYRRRCARSARRPTTSCSSRAARRRPRSSVDAHLWDLAAPGAVLAAVGGRYEYLDGGVVDLAELLDGSRAPRDVLAGRREPLRVAARGQDIGPPWSCGAAGRS